ncbi:MAG TPA: addiction module protein, partial [Gemmatimonadales bacterium]|nr:addiction module protein [Gemmatimonadales bacterium]
ALGRNRGVPLARQRSPGQLASMSNPHLDELLRLPPAERLAAIAELWDSLEQGADLFPLSEAERAELDRRLAEDAADPSPGVSWPELRRRLGGSA